MSAIPAFILKKLYVPGSLANSAEGCQLQIKNTLAPGTITGVGPVSIDETIYAPKDVTLVRGAERIAAASASSSHPIAFDVNVVVTIIVSGVTLADGEHRISLDVLTREVGRLKFDITDHIASLHA
jgi:hypothetical protein